MICKSPLFLQTKRMDNMDLRQKKRNMLREFFPLLTAVALQQILALTVNLVDNFMLGSYSETAMSGAAMVNQIQFMMQQLAAGIGAGVAVLGAQYWGKREIAPIRKIIAVGLKFALAAGLLFTVITALFPAEVISILTNDAYVTAEAVEYLDIMCWTFVIYAASSVLMYSLQSVQTAFIGMVMSGCTIFINAGLNYILIFGHFGAPELGVRGAAYATLTSRIVEFVLVLVYVLFADKKLHIRLRHLLSFDMSYLKDYIHVSLPVMMSGILWGIAQTAQTAILGHISAETIAANSISSVIFQLFAAYGMACANAASVMIGKTIGMGDMALVKPYARVLQKVFICLGVATGLLIFLCKDWIVGMYNVSDETQNLTIAFLTILSITTVGTCYEYPVESGIISGGGDTKYAAIVDNSFMWLYTIPFAFLSAFIFRWHPIATFAILKSDQLLKCIPNSIRCNRFKWIRDLTRSET